MYTAAFWKDVADRAIRTFAQALLAIFVNDQVGILELNWAQGASVAASSAAAVIIFALAYPGKEWRDLKSTRSDIRTINEENSTGEY